MTATQVGPAPVQPWVPRPLRRVARLSPLGLGDLLAQHARETDQDLEAITREARAAGRLELWDGSLVVQDGQWYRIREPLPASTRPARPPEVRLTFVLRHGRRRSTVEVTSVGMLATSVHEFAELAKRPVSSWQALDLACDAWGGADVRRGALQVRRVRG